MPSPSATGGLGNGIGWRRDRAAGTQPREPVARGDPRPYYPAQASTPGQRVTFTTAERSLYLKLRMFGRGPPADDLCQAARVSLERRLAADGVHTGWSRAWIVALWARFSEGGLAHEHLAHLLDRFCTDSLLDLHPPRILQIDGNLGGTAAIAEMLLQSHGDIIRLLLALPPQWANGSVRGLRARGGFTIEMTWRDAALVEAHVTSELGQPCRLGWPWGDPEVTCSGNAIPTQRDADGHFTFDTEPGQRMELRPM
jgi:glycosyl hydrolase family 95